jgi:hypothetical protein
MLVTLLVILWQSPQFLFLQGLPRFCGRLPHAGFWPSATAACIVPGTLLWPQPPALTMKKTRAEQSHRFSGKTSHEIPICWYPTNSSEDASYQAAMVVVKISVKVFQKKDVNA